MLDIPPPGAPATPLSFPQEDIMSNPMRPYEPLTSENAALVLIDHQVGLMTGVRDYSTGELKHNVANPPPGPWGVDALGGAVTEPAWKSKPSWYLQVRDDKMIPYPAQQFMAKRAGATVAEVPGSHAIYVSNSGAVAALIEQAASGVK
jgi:pimeloyl-ACP methyl ester carboxylesterase